MSTLLRAIVRLALVAAAIVLYGFWQQGVGKARATAAYNVAIGDQKVKAGAALAREVGKARSAELALQKFKDEQELKDAQNKLVVSGLADRLRAASGPAGRLRDPNAARCGNSGGSPPGADPAHADNRAADAAQAGGLFSAEASGLLAELTREADTINIAYASCRADSASVRR